VLRPFQHKETENDYGQLVHGTLAR
jgi:hypothetical protein